MSALLAFYIAAVTCFAVLIGSFITWKLRFLIWKGWFRAIIECEDEDILIRTVRMKPSKKLPSEQDQCVWLTVKGVRDRYDIIPDRVRYMGKFRIPTSFYYAHRAEPIDHVSMKMDSKISATRNAELARNTVTSQLISAFTENPMREAMAVFLAVVIVLGGILILGYFINSKMETIIDRL